MKTMVNYFIVLQFSDFTFSMLMTLSAAHTKWLEDKQTLTTLLFPPLQFPGQN